jgi:hypothetical protein
MMLPASNQVLIQHEDLPAIQQSAAVKRSRLGPYLLKGQQPGSWVVVYSGRLF